MGVSIHVQTFLVKRHCRSTVVQFKRGHSIAHNVKVTRECNTAPVSVAFGTFHRDR
ncbi:hypothetical protein BGZ82_005564, partial [Podila clonocystis]